MKLTKMQQELFDKAMEDHELKELYDRAKKLNISEWRILCAIDHCELPELIEAAEACRDVKGIANEALFLRVHDALRKGVLINHERVPIDGLTATQLLQADGIGARTVDVLVETGRVFDDRKPLKRKCPKCGDTIQDRWSFCPKCGQKID